MAPQPTMAPAPAVPSGRVEVGVDPRFSSIDLGAGHGCGIMVDGRLYCWGAAGFKNAPAPEYIEVESVTIGASHSCGLRADGTATCWGGNTLHDDNPVEASVPQDLRRTQFASFSAGRGFNCGLTNGGELLCWGGNVDGIPKVPGGSDFKAVDSGSGHACAVTGGHEVVCWGRVEGRAPDGPFVSVSAGAQETCALTPEGWVYCWNTEGEPTESPEGAFQQIDVGNGIHCGVRVNGSLDCWGRFIESHFPHVLEGAYTSEGVSKVI